MSNRITKIAPDELAMWNEFYRGVHGWGRQQKFFKEKKMSRMTLYLVLKTGRCKRKTYDIIKEYVTTNSYEG